MAKILDEEYDENKNTEKAQKLEYAEFQNILDNHIVDMETRKKDKGGEELDTTSSNRKNNKQNEKESQFDNMLKNMANLSDDEDFGENNMDNAIMQENKHKADREFLNEELEVLTKWKNGKEYQSEIHTSSAGGKLIINTIKKRTKKGKRRQREIEEEEKDAKKSS
jgi:hypothetical protein